MTKDTQIIEAQVVTQTHAVNESERHSLVQRLKIAEAALRWTLRLVPLLLLALGYVQPAQTTAVAVQFATAREGLYLHALLVLVAFLEREALARWARHVARGAITWYAAAYERQKQECSVYRAEHPSTLERGWDAFWKARAERQKQQASWEAARRKHIEEVEMLKRDFPGLNPDAVLRLRDQVKREAEATALGRMRNAEPQRPPMTDVSVDGIHVSDIAREIAQSCTAAVQDLEALGVSHRKAMRISATLRECSFPLYSDTTGRTLSMEPVAYMDARNGRLVTLNTRLVEQDADVRAQMVESVLRRNLLKQDAVPYPRVTGSTPTEHGTPYDVKAAPKTAAARRG